MIGYSADLKGQPGLSYLGVEKVSAILKGFPLLEQDNYLRISEKIQLYISKR
jgi:hypothetical protein